MYGTGHNGTSQAWMALPISDAPPSIDAFQCQCLPAKKRPDSPKARLWRSPVLRGARHVSVQAALSAAPPHDHNRNCEQSAVRCAHGRTCGCWRGTGTPPRHREGSPGDHLLGAALTCTPHACGLRHVLAIQIGRSPRTALLLGLREVLSGSVPPRPASQRLFSAIPCLISLACRASSRSNSGSGPFSGAALHHWPVARLTRGQL